MHSDHLKILIKSELIYINADYAGKLCITHRYLWQIFLYKDLDSCPNNCSWKPMDQIV